MAKLTVISGPCRGLSFDLDDKHWQTAIGRDGQDADIVIHDIAVSRRHAFLSFRDGQWALHDANSANGTFVNEEKITGAVLLRHNDQISCGTTVLLFESEEQPAEQARIEYPANKVFDSSETITGLSLDRLGLGPSAGQQERIYQAGQAAINVSHGVKNLLQALAGSREVIEHGLKTGDMEKVGRSWEILKRNLERIERLVLDMLSFGRPVRLEYGPCRLNRLVDMVIEILSAQAADKGVQLSVTADKRIGIVQLDADRMHEAMMNIVINAIEAAPARTGVVSVTTEIRRPGNIIILCISDNGPGIEDTRSIFLPFYSTKSRLGTGLGLPIAKKIIELHKGTIEVQSTANQGSSFIITIPISPD